MAGRPRSFLPNDIYRMTPEDTTLFKLPEQPSDEITVKILLTKLVSAVLLKDLNRRLTPDNMTASGDKNNKNAVVVRGIRPYNSYGAHDILTVVQKLDGGARIIS